MMRKLRAKRVLRNRKSNSNSFQENIHQQSPSGQPYFTDDLEQNINQILSVIGNSPDFILRHIETGTQDRPVKAAIVYIDGLVDTADLGELVINPLLYETSNKIKQLPVSHETIDLIEKHVLSLSEIKRVNSIPKAINDALRGNSILIIDGQNTALSCSTQGFETRSIQEPTIETVIRGPKEGFTENIRTNIAQLRRKISSPDLKLEEMNIGKYSQTKVVIAYVSTIVTPGLVSEVRERLSEIDIDGVMDSGYIEQLIEDAPYSLFPTIGNTEKPDVTATRLLEGRVAILVDGSPMVLTVPRLFWEVIQSPEDYYSRPFNSSAVRLIRLLFLIVSVVLPGFYVAVLNFHPEMIPRILVVTLAAAEEGVPFPLVVEVILFGLAFEGLREAGVRLPRPVGSAVTIVGALIIGQATVEAGLVSSSTVIVTAFIGIASFITPGIGDIFIITRLVLVLLSGFLGLFGLIMGGLIFYIHMCSLRSFGVPYVSPLAPVRLKEWKDLIIRAPLWLLDTRPNYVGSTNKHRMGSKMRPEPPNSE